METIKKFMPADRYVFDFKLCAPRDGWAQVDTSQDASYYGTWANPFKLEVITYLEGDIVIKKADNTDEFTTEIRDIKKWNNENGFRFIGIDALCREELIGKFQEVGLGDLLH
jgi:hypothetical protein